jgi:hypothetical protein
MTSPTIGQDRGQRQSGTGTSKKYLVGTRHVTLLWSPPAAVWCNRNAARISIRHQIAVQHRVVEGVVAGVEHHGLLIALASVSGRPR